MMEVTDRCRNDADLVAPRYLKAMQKRITETREPRLTSKSKQNTITGSKAAIKEKVQCKNMLIGGRPHMKEPRDPLRNGLK